MVSVRTEVHGEGRFMGMRDEWSALLAHSDADQLFASWDWLSRWWRAYRDDLGLEAVIVLAYAGERLVGIAPLQVRRVRHRSVLSVRQCELIGNAWRAGAAMSERTGFVVDVGCPDAYDALAAAALALPGIDVLLLEYSQRQGPTWRALEREAAVRGLRAREIDPLVAYEVNVDDGFKAWLTRLSPRSRRRVYNERHKLESFGAVCWEAATPETATEFWADLDRLHSKRWGWQATAGRRGQFYRDYCDSQWVGGNVVLRRLRVGGCTIAALHAYRHGDRIRELQNAIDAGFSKSISPGYLQAGYLLEEAAGAGVRTVDFLGGRGRSTDYKAHLASSETQLGCLQVLRAGWLSMLYRLRDATRG